MSRVRASKDLAKQILDQQKHLLKLKKAALIKAARQDVNCFIEYVMKDEETGNPIYQAPMHEQWHKLAAKHDRLLIWSHVEAGKALPLDTEIQTPDGWTTMGEIQVGDTVMGRDGKPTKVTSCTEVQLDRQVYEIEFDDGVIVKADADHRWVAWNTDDLAAHREPRVVTTQEMLDNLTRGNDKRAHWRIPTCDPVDYPEKPLTIHPYVLGYWLGDGSKYGPHFTFHRDDQETINRCIVLEGGLHGQIKWTGNTGEVVIGGDIHNKKNPNRLKQRLRDLDLLLNKHIPLIYQRGSIEQRKELLRGLLDSDGSIDSRDNKSVVEFTNTNKRLAYDVWELARSLGLKAKITEGRATFRGEDMGTKYRVSFTARSFPVFYLRRKLEQQKLDGEDRWTRHRSVKDIRPVPTEPVRCITVDNHDHTYLIDRSYTVTHNTFQIAVARTLWELGRNPNLRFCLISNTHGQAKKVAAAIRQYVEESPELREVFPHLKPGHPWGGAKFSVKRTTIAKDPSVQCTGVHGSILGARLDRIIIDDILDYENTRTEHARQDVIHWYKATPGGRLVKNGRILCIGNAHHPRDLLHDFANNPQWAAFRYPIRDDVTGKSRWPDVWPEERIESKIEELGSTEAARQLFCLARDDHAAKFKQHWIDKCLDLGNGKSMASALKVVPQGYRIYTGVDLAVQKSDGADLTVFFTIAVDRFGVRHVLSIESGHMSGPEIVNKVIDVHHRYQSIVVVENNAAQDYILQFTRAQSAVPLKAYTTGRTKAHPEFGIESIGAELENGKWVIPNHNRICHPEIQAWIDEMLYYSPDAHTGDRLMAAFFAREGAEKAERDKVVATNLRRRR